MSLIQRLATLAAVIAMTACGAVIVPVTPPADGPVAPPAATQHAVGLTVRDAAGPVYDAACSLDGATDAAWANDHRNHSDTNGTLIFPSVPLSLRATQLSCTAAGYRPFSEHRDLLGADPEPSLVARLTPLRSTAGEAGALSIRGRSFTTADGRPWIGRGITDFLLFAKFLAGDDLDPILTERVAHGRNYVRVFGMLGSWGNAASSPADGLIHLYPQEHADYLAQLGAFVDYLALFQMRVEFVIFADASIVMPDYAERQAHADRVVAALAGHWNVLGCEYGNEPFKNVPGGDAEAATEARRLKGRGVLIAAGDVSALPWATAIIPTGDYGTHHGERGAEWTRVGRAVGELQDASGIPFISDEPMGASATNQPGRRSNVAADYLHFAATVTLFGSALFHCDRCITSDLLGPEELAALDAFDFGQHWVPREAQTWPYQRGDNCGDCAGIGNMPMRQWDLPHPQGSLRTFCKGDGTVEYCDANRPADGWRAIAREGWHIVAEPRRGFVELAR